MVFNIFSNIRTAGMAWSVSIELRDMPRYYRLRTVLPRRSRNAPKGRCSGRSQARNFHLGVTEKMKCMTLWRF